MKTIALDKHDWLGDRRQLIRFFNKHGNPSVHNEIVVIDESGEDWRHNIDWNWSPCLSDSFLNRMWSL